MEVKEKKATDEIVKRRFFVLVFEKGINYNKKRDFYD